MKLSSANSGNDVVSGSAVAPLIKLADLIKLAVGIAGTALIATMAYRLVRSPILADLGGRSADVMLANGITDGRVNWQSPAGWTRRVARLSGGADPAAQVQARNAVAALPGIHDAIWVAGAIGPAKAAPPTNAASCQVAIDAIMGGTTIAFSDGDAVIDAESLLRLDRIAEALSTCPTTRVTIASFSDDSAVAAAINLSLSQARADAVARAISSSGIDPRRLQPSGRGSVGAATSPSGRIEFTVTPGKALPT